jgi:N-acetylglucosaminyldiphosphoundecaprenol N-acetyl-beta-D-mannosaminyltransferase
MTTTEPIMGYFIRTEPVSACVDDIFAWVKDSARVRCIVCANPHSLVEATKDTLFGDALRSADLLVPDGAGIVLASRLLGGSIRSRITGTDIFVALNEKLNAAGNHSCFFLGSTKTTLQLITARMKREYPAIKITGTYSPPFKEEFSDEDNQAMVEAVNRAKADVLWVGMTAPKQEKWIYRHKDFLQVKFIGAIGAAFDFFAGTRKRSHPWFQEHGLEWLPRLLREPQRLWYRNFVSTPRFLFAVLLERLGR